MPTRYLNPDAPIQSGLDAFVSGAAQAYTGIRDERRKRQEEAQKDALLRQQMQIADEQNQRANIDAGMTEVNFDPVTIPRAPLPEGAGVRAKIGNILSHVFGSDTTIQPTGTLVKTGESQQERITRMGEEGANSRNAATIASNRDLTTMREAGDTSRNAASNATSIRVAQIGASTPSWQTVTTQDGRMYQVNPKDGSTRPIGLMGKASGSGDSLGTVATRSAAATIPELQGAAKIIDRFSSPSLMSQLQKKAGVFGNYANTPEGRQLNQAIDQFVTLSELAKGNKRPTEAMMKRFYAIYAPAPGDDDAVMEQKRAARQTLIESVTKVAGHMAPGADSTAASVNPFQSLIPKKP